MSSLNSKGADWVRKQECLQYPATRTHRTFKFMTILDTNIFSFCLRLHKNVD